MIVRVIFSGHLVNLRLVRVMQVVFVRVLGTYGRSLVRVGMSIVKAISVGTVFLTETLLIIANKTILIT